MVDIRIGDPFYDDCDPRVHLHHLAPPSEGASLGGMSGRARGLLGGCFMGCMMAQHGGAWVNPYITDGLIAMVDGDWNAGGGIHSASGVVNIAGTTAVAHIIGNPTIGEYFINTGAGIVAVDLSSMYGSAESQIDLLGHCTIEMVYRWISGTDETAILSLCYGGHTARGLYLAPRGSVGVTMSTTGMLGYKDSSYNITYPYGSVLQSGNIYDMIITANGQSATVTERRHGDTKSRSAGMVSSGYNGWLVIGASMSTIKSYNNIDILSVRLYNRVLSVDEAGANYAIDQQRFGLV